MKKIVYLFLLFTLGANLVLAQAVKIETLSTGLLYPVGIHNSGLPNDNRLFILEKRGRIKIVDRLTGAVTATPFLDIYNKVYPITTSFDERGLLGLAFHPDYANNGYFYVNYINTNGKTIIARYQVSSFADTALSNSEQIIMSIFQPYTNHNGGNLMFGPKDAYLYISLGDGGSGGDPGNRAQNKDSLLGKTLRIDVNNPAPPYYFSAPGNPFYGSTAGRDEIFDWGLRNHWRCSFDRLTGDMWTADVGQGQYEEINFRSNCDTVGHNYGWKCYEGNTAYNTAGCQAQSTYEAPVFDYSHSLGCSVTGGYVYRGAQEGSLFGKYLFTDYCQGRIWATTPNGSGGWTTSQLIQTTAQINNNYSSWGEDVYGELYLAGVSSGRIYRLRDTACAPVAYIQAPDTLYSCSANTLTFSAIKGTGLTYSWTLSGGNWSVSAGQGTEVLTVSPDVNTTATLVMSVSNGTCSATSNSVVIIAGSSISGLQILYCDHEGSVALTGFPAGGNFSGQGITGTMFEPAVVGAGVYTLSYNFSDTASACNYTASGCVLSTSRTVSVAVCGGLKEQSLLSNISIYPNPGESGFNVEFYSAKAGLMDLSLTDVLGKVIFTEQIRIVQGKQIIPIAHIDVAEGIYFLNLQTEQSRRVEKIVVKR